MTRPRSEAHSDVHGSDAHGSEAHGPRDPRDSVPRLDAPRLQAHRITRTVDGRALIDGVDCTAPAGTLTALVGPNGAGKSTLLRILAGIDRPDQGSVTQAGTDLFRMPRRERARRIALVEQDASTELALSVTAVVALGRTPHHSLWSHDSALDASIVNSALDRVGMSEYAEREITSLSGGERQRVQLARALAQEPELLILDEPTNHLDIQAQLATLELLGGLATHGMAVLAALHDLGLAAASSDRVIVLSAGRVVAAGETRAVLTAELIREVFNVDAVLIENPLTGRPMLASATLGSVRAAVAISCPASS
ncbi:ABC transporter ATP-binding protein [Leifsonia kafniensis]|uniref:ABC transporter ATP-binding protein n=1 Tax=Leifsonia kafniensis TaxID=475957 RepID=A0ABP7KHA1_9MICO